MFTFSNAFFLLLGAVLVSLIAMAYFKFSPRVKRLFNRDRHVDLNVTAKLATCAESIAIQADTNGESLLVFTYRGNTYAMRSNCSLAWERAPEKWTVLPISEGLDIINSMVPRKPKQQNNNSNSHNGNKSNDKPKQNVIPNDQAEHWLDIGKSWEKRPNFTLNKPYFLCISDAHDETSGLWIVGKSRNGHKS